MSLTTVDEIWIRVILRNRCFRTAKLPMSGGHIHGCGYQKPERDEKASVLRALVSPTCLNLRVPSSRFLRADSEVERSGTRESRSPPSPASSSSPAAGSALAVRCRPIPKRKSYLDLNLSVPEKSISKLIRSIENELYSEPHAIDPIRDRKPRLESGTNQAATRSYR
jgi:hypothetical protein